MSKISLSILVLATCVSISGLSGATVPELIPVQGVLSDADGNPVEGAVDIQFSLYASSQGGEALWSESHALDLEGGFYTIALGSEEPLDVIYLLAGPELWLGITVNEDSEMDRLQLSSVPFALQAQRVGSFAENDIQPVLSGARACAEGFYFQGWDAVNAQAICASDLRGVTVEQDPTFASSPAAGIGEADVTAWNTAVGWGDHGQAGYLTAYAESDPEWTAAAEGVQNSIAAVDTKADDNAAAITQINSRQRLSDFDSSPPLEVMGNEGDVPTGLTLSVSGRGRDVLMLASVNVNNAVDVADTSLDFKVLFNGLLRRTETVVLKAGSRQVVSLQWLERSLPAGTHTFEVIVTADNRVNLENRSMYVLEQ